MFVGCSNGNVNGSEDCIELKGCRAIPARTSRCGAGVPQTYRPARNRPSWAMNRVPNNRRERSCAVSTPPYRPHRYRLYCGIYDGSNPADIPVRCRGARKIEANIMTAVDSPETTLFTPPSQAFLDKGAPLNRARELHAADLPVVCAGSSRSNHVAPPSSAKNSR